jgi:PPM family protein phosphatase
MRSDDKDEAPATLTVCGATDVGLCRDQNEDTFVIAKLLTDGVSKPCVDTKLSVSDGLLLVVCDGMGGAAAGEVAARIAAESVRKTLVEAGPSVARGAADSLTAAVTVANQSILDEVQVHPEERGMGTTCTAAVVIDGKVVVAQIGDSRAYLLHDGALHVLTRDQSLANALLDRGALRPEQVQNFPHRNVLSQALGNEKGVHPVLSEHQLQTGDKILLCSDGLHGSVTDDDIRDTLAMARDLNSTAKALVGRALAAGGPDNITVVVASYEEGAA